MYPTRSKEASLPIERTELGYVQHTLYRQPDLYHEAVIELDSPFAAIFAADTAVFSFLVLGDQNAGKSTFLHAFTYSEDQNFLQLSSYLPILTSTFVNSRFLVNSSRAPRDELPFLDTDIARGTFLLSLEDFYFFLNENSLPLERVPETTRFALVQFIEIGGDHLDLMMHPQQSTSPHATEIAEKSLQLLRGTRKTIYFANCATLFPASPAGSGHRVLDAAALATLEQRLAFLNAQLAPGHEILFYLSRPPAALDLHASCDVAAKHSELAAASAPGLLALFRALTALLAQRHAWALAVGAVYEARHLRPDQTLDTDVLVEMVAQLFRHGMMGAERGTEPVVVAHLLRCHRTLRERVDLETGEITIWITPSVFGDYLEAQHGTEVPESLLLQQFPSVAHRLAAGGLCIAHARHHFSSLTITLASDSGRTLLTWYPAGLALSAPPAAAKPSSVVIPTLKSAAPRPSEAQVRFPLYSPLYDVIAFYAANHVPPGFWLTDESAIRIRLSGAIATRLGEVLRHLAEEEIPRQWRSLLHAPADRRASSASVLVWLLEEWHLGARLLSPAGGAHHSFPVCLPLPAGFEPSALASLFPHSAPPAPAADARPSVTVRLQSAA